MTKDEALRMALEAFEEISTLYMSLPKKGCMALAAIEEVLAQPDYRAMYLKVRDELAALQQSRAPLTSKEIRAIEVDVATNLSLDYPSPAEQFTRAIEARHGIK